MTEKLYRNENTNFSKGQTSITCVTGKMASGKNYICSLLEKMNFVSIDADILVHKAIENSSEKILAAFSEKALSKGIQLQNEDGSINRRALGKLIFRDAELLKKQEEIVYPEVMRLAREFIAENSDKNILINATVAYKTPELLNMCNRILYVKCPFFIRLKRAENRDKMKIVQILQRFRAQRFLLFKYKKAGIPLTVIRNTGSEKSIIRRLNKIFN